MMKSFSAERANIVGNWYCSFARRTDVNAAIRFAGLIIGMIVIAFPTLTLAERAPIKGIGVYTIPSWFKQSFLVLPEEATEAGRSGKRLFVYFGQDGCPYCAELFNNNFSQRHIVDFTRKHFECIDINMWGDREVTDLDGQVLSEKDFSAKHKVWFTPTILFFDDKGKRVLRLNGYLPPHQFLAALQYVAERKDSDLSFHEFLAKTAPGAARGALHSKPFFRKPPLELNRLTDKPLAVFFEQKDCLGCDQLHQKTLQLPETLAQIQRFHVVQLDRWSDTPVTTPDGKNTTARDWADELKIAYVPSAVMFDEKKEVIRIEAMFKSFHVQSVLDYAASGAYKTQPSLQRFIQSRADHLREKGVTVDLWN
jgi:thioredoxin-related protein